MDWDDRVSLNNNAMFLTWIRKYDLAREEKLTDWVTTFHPDRLSCKLATHKRHDSRGAYNLSCKVEFENGERWMIRFPMVGKVKYADEKTEIEVATMKLIREQTSIPVPEVKAWGLAADNPLEIGPFIMMDFIQGVGVDDIIQHPDSRIMREDVSEHTVEVLFRQMVQFSLELWKLDFSHIGSVTSVSEASTCGVTSTVHSQPFTKKVHDYLVDGGVDILGPRSKTFSSATEYFNYIIDGDLKHLHEQPNSVDDEADAREKYIYFNIMKALVSRHVLPDLDGGPFKLACDDFQPTNMIVNNGQDLKVIAVIDWEWSYTAPAQMAHSVPSWLLIQSPNAWAKVDERLSRFERHLELYTRILEEEEEELKTLKNNQQKPSALLRACMVDGRQWFHFLLLRGFNGPRCVPFTKLREETKDWVELAAAIPEEDISSFVTKKMTDLENYGKQLAETEGRYKAALKGDLKDLHSFLAENEHMLSLKGLKRE